MHPLDQIYKPSNMQTSGHPLDAVYGIANSQTPQQQVGQSLQDTGVQTLQQNEPGLIKRGIQAVGSAITDPFLALGGGVANVIRAGLGREQQTGPMEGISGGQVNPVGYRDGQRLSAGQTIAQGAGNVLMAGANLYTGGKAGPVISALKSGILPKILPMIKTGAKIGGAYGGGSALEQGKSAGDVALETGIGAGIGGTLAPVAGLATGLASKVYSQGISKAAQELTPRNPFKSKTIEEILATPESQLGKLTTTERNIYFNEQTKVTTNKYQSQSERLAQQQQAEINAIKQRATDIETKVATEHANRISKLAEEETALKNAVANKTIEEAQAMKPQARKLISDKSKEYVRLIDEEMPPEVATSKITVEELVNSIKSGIDQKNPLAVKQAEDDILKLRQSMPKESTVRDVYELAKELRTGFGKTAGSSRTFSADEIAATRLIERLTKFLREQRGVDLSNANKFWSEWKPNQKLLIQKIQPYSQKGLEGTSFNKFTKQLVSRKPEDVNFLKKIEENLGIKLDDLESNKLLSKLDDVKKAKVTADIEKKTATDKARLKKAQSLLKATNEKAVKKGEITEAKATELEKIKMTKYQAQLKAEKRTFIIKILKVAAGITALGGGFSKVTSNIN